MFPHASQRLVGVREAETRREGGGAVAETEAAFAAALWPATTEAAGSGSGSGAGAASGAGSDAGRSGCSSGSGAPTAAAAGCGADPSCCTSSAASGLIRDRGICLLSSTAAFSSCAEVAVCGSVGSVGPAGCAVSAAGAARVADAAGAVATAAPTLPSASTTASHMRALQLGHAQDSDWRANKRRSSSVYVSEPTPGCAIHETHSPGRIVV